MPTLLDIQNTFRDVADAASSYRRGDPGALLALAELGDHLAQALEGPIGLESALVDVQSALADMRVGAYIAADESVRCLVDQLAATTDLVENGPTIIVDLLVATGASALRAAQQCATDTSQVLVVALAAAEPNRPIGQLPLRMAGPQGFSS